jgi:hypothetical protein
MDTVDIAVNHSGIAMAGEQAAFLISKRYCCGRTFIANSFDFPIETISLYLIHTFSTLSPRPEVVEGHH